MNTNKLREIDRLVSEMCDDGLAGDDARQLEKLLACDPIAQKHYWQLVNTHVALSVAVSSNSLSEDSTRTRLAGALPASESSEIGGVSRLHFMRPWWPAVAAAVLVVGFFGGLALKWNGESLDDNPPQMASQPAVRTIEAMPTITQVSWEGPSFADDSNDWQPANVVSAGAITLRVNVGEVADGYLFRLMPGESVKLLATFDATGENSLSVVEITGGERATIKKVSFHNSGAGPKPLHANPHARNRRYGILGHWSENNTGVLPRHFLLTGVHKLAGRSEHDSWRLSKIAVLVENDDVVHLGWDDSGPAPLDGQNYHEDDDYDDLAASLWFERRSGSSHSSQGEIQVVSNPELSALPLTSVPEGGSDFELPPYSAAIVKAASEARNPSAIVAVDVDTQQILWSSSKQTIETTNLGAASLLNPTAKTKRIRLIGVHKPGDSQGPGIPWRASAVETLYEQPGFFIVGFDDSVGDKDFNDVRVSVLITAVREPNSP